MGLQNMGPWNCFHRDIGLLIWILGFPKCSMILCNLTWNEIVERACLIGYYAHYCMVIENEN